jgi:hypothetical protein
LLFHGRELALGERFAEFAGRGPVAGLSKEGNQLLEIAPVMLRILHSWFKLLKIHEWTEIDDLHNVAATRQ